MRNRVLVFLSFVLMLFLVPALAAHAAAGEGERLAGSIEARVGDRIVRFPSLKTDIRADVKGDLATVTVVQTFANPLTEPLHASYLFPLNHDAAVHEMWLEVGGERIRAQIQEKREAQRTFKRAKSEGRAAALLEEHRPNMFTQRIANLMPNLPVKVTLRYVQTVPKVDGEYELVVPLVVGPRFQPEHSGRPPALTKISTEPMPAPARDGRWSLEALPDYPPVAGLHLPPQIDAERVALSVTIDGGLPIREASSRTHAITTDTDSTRRWRIGLAQGRVIDNRDFVLRYRLAGSRTSAGLLVQRDGHGGFFSLLIEPPASPADADIAAREMVFLLDCSGSMHGLPMDASKAFMRAALRKLRPTDSFRIIRFSDSATEFSELPLSATPENLARGLHYIESLRGEGGTMMSSGIRQALAVPVAPGTKRIVTFLTDGYIGNELEILTMVQDLLGDARLYAFGVGAGVNRFLMDELGRAGRGFTRYMDPTEDVSAVVAELTDRLQSPVLTDIRIDWAGLDVGDVLPQKIPDLFAGQSLRVQGRYHRAGRGTIRIHGNAGGRRATLLLPVELPERANDGETVGRIWARSAIAESMYQLSLPPRLFEQRGEPVPSLESVKRRVTELGLQFALVTRWTSFVAVSERVVNADAASTPETQIPLPPVAGVSPRAYGSSAPAFVGAAGPEPSTWAALALLLACLLWSLRHTRVTQPSLRSVRHG